jgi:hypothetical protein
MLGRACIAGVVGSMIVMGAACLGAPAPPTPEPPIVREDVPPTPTPDGESSPAATASPPPSPAMPTTLTSTERVRVVGAGKEGVNLRAQPGAAGARLKGLFDGVELEVIGPDSSEDGRTWRNVRDPADRTEGWVAGEFLAPPSGAPASPPASTPAR